MNIMRAKRVCIVIIITISMLQSQFPFYVEQSIFVQGSHDPQYNLSKTEVLEIAKNNPQVASWMENRNNIVYDITIWDNYWYVRFSSSGSFIPFLDDDHIEIIISDLTGNTIHVTNLRDISKHTPSFEDVYDYFYQQPISKFFPNTTLEFNLQRIGPNILQLRGTNQSGIVLIAAIAYQINVRANPVYSYILLEVSSSGIFGSPTVDIDYINSSLSGMDVVNDFITKNPVYELEIRFIQHFESDYSKHQVGQVFVANLSSSINSDTIIYDFDNEVFYNSSQVDGDSNLPITRSITSGLNPNLILNFDLDGNLIESYGGYTEISFEELINLYISDFEVLKWITELEGFTGKVYYNHNETYILHIESTFSRAEANFWLNINSSTVEKKQFENSISPTKSEEEIDEIIYQDSDFVTWKSNLEKPHYKSFFDMIDTWTFVYYDPSISDRIGYVLVNDTSGTIISRSLNEIDLQPNLTQEIVISILSQTEELENFYYLYPDAELIYYYGNNYWNVYAFSQQFISSYLRFLIDDTSGEVVDITDVYSHTNTNYDIKGVFDIIESDPNYLKFINNDPIVYNYSYYRNGVWNIVLRTLSEHNYLRSITFSVTDYDGEITDFTRFEGFKTMVTFTNNYVFLRLLNYDHHLLGELSGLALSSIYGPIDSDNTLNLGPESSSNEVNPIFVIIVAGFILGTILFVLYRHRSIDQRVE